MERKTSAIATGVATAVIFGLILGAYVGAYWWRLPVAVDVESNYEWKPGAIRLAFPNSLETIAFQPATWIHQRAHWESFEERAGSAYLLTSFGCFGGP